MFLSELLKNVAVSKVFQTNFGRMAVTTDIQIKNIQYNSQKINREDLFVAIKGKNFDGHKFIQDAISRGAKAVVLEDDSTLPDSYFMHTGVVKIVVSNTRKALAIISSNFYGNPSKTIDMVGVTGTNGKTTVTYLLKSIFEEVNKNSNATAKIGLIGTIENKLGNETFEAELTTPESLELNRLLNIFAQQECSKVVMEVSSHSLHQDRVHGIDYKTAVFTNLSQDHLDYHETMDNYFRAKKILFDNLSENSVAVSNADDEYGLKILESCKAKKITYGINKEADVTAKNIKLNLNETRFTLIYRNQEIDIKSPLIGTFNVYNVLAAITAALMHNVDMEIIKYALENLQPVKGRFEKLISPKGFIVVIDYAHTPDAIEKCLISIRHIMKESGSAKGKIITVFGAGGDRDKTKRPKMGKIATELSDLAIITSDNPRTENPYQIMMDIAAGVETNSGYIQEIDRKLAIEKAISLASSGDVILIAGKGHENYQIIGTEKSHFSDQEVVNLLIDRN